MDRSKKNTVFTILAMIILAAVIVGGYFLVLNRDRKRSENIDKNNMTEVQKLITRDLEESYPITPGELIKYYSKITKSFYGEVYTDAEFESLVDQMRLLFDEEFLENNPRIQHVDDLQREINEYKDAERTIVTYVIQKNSFVTYQTMESRDYAIILASYSVKEKKPKAGNRKTYQKFMLRKDESGKWKILGWDVTMPVEFAGE